MLDRLILLAHSAGEMAFNALVAPVLHQWLTELPHAAGLLLGSLLQAFLA